MPHMFSRVNEEYDPDDRYAGQMIAGTEDEIWRETNGLPDDDDTGDNDLERTEGWDGSPLDDAEIAHRNIFGDGDTDRPVETAERDELQVQLEASLERERQLDQMLGQALADPQRQAAERAVTREQLRENLQNQYGLLSVDDAQLDRFAADLGGAQLQTQQLLVTTAANGSMTAAAQQYGDQFLRAHEALTNGPQPGQRGFEEHARAVQHIISGGTQAGERLMEWAYGPDGYDRAPPPFMAGSRSASRRSVAPRGEPEHDWSGYNDSDWMSGQRDPDEDAVFRYATRGM
jgi:hypothetical protein